VKRPCLTLLFGVVLSIAFCGAQESRLAGKGQSNGPSIHYALVGQSREIQVAIDLDKFVLEWFEKNVERFDQMSQTEKDDVARRLLSDESLDYVDVRLVNNTNRTIMLSAEGDTLTVSFEKAQAEYKSDMSGADYPSQLEPGSEAELRFPVATTVDAKMEIGRLAASLSRIDYMIDKDLRRKRASDPAQANEGATERPEARMAPIARSILDQDLFGLFYLGGEGIRIPLVFRISTADVEAPSSR
jgi:hypothetical protein